MCVGGGGGGGYRLRVSTNGIMLFYIFSNHKGTYCHHTLLFDTSTSMTARFFAG